MFKKVSIVLFVAVGFTACNEKGNNEKLATADQDENLEMVSLLDSGSYAAGMNLANNFKQQFDERFNYDAFLAGFKAVAKEDSAKFTEQEADQLVQMLMQEMQKEQQQKAMQDGQKTMQEGEAFLQQNQQREEVKQLESGLQYEVVKEGTGPSPTKDDIVKVHYTGKFLNGEVFDSSVERGQPAEFPVSGVIAGWTEALQLMKEGGKWKLYIPYYLAYGERGNQGIPPFSTLIFDVELLEVKK